MERRMGVQPHIVYQEPKAIRGLLAVFWEFLLLFAMQAGWILFFGRMIRMDDQSLLVQLFVAVVSALLVCLLSVSSKGKKAALFLLPGAAFLLILFYGAGTIFYGAVGYINMILHFYNVAYEDAVSLFFDGVASRQDMLAFSYVALLLVTAWFFIMLQKRNIVLAFLVPFLVIVTGLVTNRFSATGCACFLVALFGMWLYQIRQRASIRRLFWLLGLEACLFILAFSTNNGTLSSMEMVKTKVEQAVSYVRYGKDNLPYGDLSKTGQLLKGKKNRLIVTTDQPKDLYLRGYVGSRYEDGCYKPLLKSAYKGKYKAMLSWLSEHSFIPQKQYAEYKKQEKNTEGLDNHVVVENVGASRKYLYAPYSLKAFYRGEGIAKDDTSYCSNALFGTSEYELLEYSGSNPGELLSTDNWIDAPQTKGQSAYAKAESVYAQFVYDNYLTVENDLGAMIKDIFFSSTENDEDSIYAVTERIRTVLSERTQYTASPKAAPEGVEPISYFLNESQEGNSVLYAAAAVQAYRVKGIPARYVEGYLLKASELQPEQKKPVTLTSKNSHAWVEVYLDGSGWVPVDVTPGFYYDSYTLLQMVKKPQTVDQTAGQGESTEQSQEVKDNGKGAKQKKKERPSFVLYVDPLLWILVVFLLISAVLEAMMLYRRAAYLRRYRAASEEERTRLLLPSLFELLALYGYDARPGYRVKELDQQLAAQFAGIEPGDYRRITDILEKYLYGQTVLAPYENRVIAAFFEHLYEGRKEMSFWMRCRVWYVAFSAGKRT